MLALKDNGFPTALAARKCLTGDCGEAIFCTAKRAAMLALWMYIFGEKKDIPKRAIAGSLAIQAFVMGWTFFTCNDAKATLPSVDAVESNNIAGIVGTYFLRSGMVYGGMYLAGIRTNLLRNALAGTGMVEASILVWNDIKNG